MVAVLAVVLFLIAALVVDLGLARDTRRQSQNAADASALAAANVLYPDSSTCQTPSGVAPPCFDDAVSAARSYALTNYGVDSAAWSGCSDSSALTYRPDAATACISFDNSTQPTQVRVLVPVREVATGFGRLADVTTIPIQTGARAAVSGSAARTCGLCFLSDVEAGNADFTVSPGGILVNGNISAGPNSVWKAGSAIGVTGTTSGGQFLPEVTTTTEFPDPLAGLSFPSLAGLSVKSDPCDTGAAHGPGIYGSVDLGKGTCALQPGTYAVVGTWGAKNNTYLTGTGVTIYVLCGTTAAPRACGAAGEEGGALDFKNGEVNLVAPATAPNQDLAIVYDRNNTSDLSLQGNGGASLTGTVYLKSGTLDFNGNSCFGFVQGPVVSGGVTKANGNKACVNVSQSVDASVAGTPSSISLDQ